MENFSFWGLWQFISYEKLKSPKIPIPRPDEYPALPVFYIRFLEIFGFYRYIFCNRIKIHKTPNQERRKPKFGKMSTKLYGTDQHLLGERVEGDEGGEPAHKLRDHTELNQVLGLHLRQVPGMGSGNKIEKTS